MNASENYEIARALDDLPHIVGATCATALFRASNNKNPSRIEYRKRAAEYFTNFASQIQKDDGLASLAGYIKSRINEETQRILEGRNQQIERRYERYIDYS